MAVMVVTLTIILLSLLINTTLSSTISQITDRIDVSVYLNDSVTQAQTDELIRDIEALPNVSSTEFLSKEDLLKHTVKKTLTIQIYFWRSVRLIIHCQQQFA